MKKLLWFTLQSSQGPVPVYVVKQLPGMQGCFDTRRQHILIKEAAPGHMMSILGHELIHATTDSATWHTRVASCFPSKTAKEERLVGFLQLTLMASMYASGLFVAPTPPTFKKKKRKR